MLPCKWQEAGDRWSNNAIIEISVTENDSLKCLISQTTTSGRTTSGTTTSGATTSETTTSEKTTSGTTTEDPTTGISRSSTQSPSQSCNHGEFYTDANDCVHYYHCRHGSLVSEALDFF